MPEDERRNRPEDDADRARPVGINHVALAVGDIEAALDFYRDLFRIELRGRTDSMAFLDMGDQFVALAETDAETDGDDHRHFGLVVDEIDAVRRRLDELGVERLGTDGLDFRDPWGNRVQVVAYADVQFTKADHVLDGMGLDLGKTDDALAELDAKGLSPE